MTDPDPATPPVTLPRRRFSDLAVRHACISAAAAALVVLAIWVWVAPGAMGGAGNFAGSYGTLAGRDGSSGSFWQVASFLLLTAGMQAVAGGSGGVLLHLAFRHRERAVMLPVVPLLLALAAAAGWRRYVAEGAAPGGGWNVVAAEIALWTPFMLLLTLAALGAIPRPLYEAAAVDRASHWFRFRNLTLPLIAPPVLLGFVFRGVDTFAALKTGRPPAELLAVAYPLLVTGIVAGALAVYARARVAR